MSISGKAVSGIKWTAASQVIKQSIQFITAIILARLLTPVDFGLMGMAMVVNGFLGLFKDLGTSSAVIRRKELSDPFLSTVFWTNSAFGVITMIVLFFLAPLIALFFNEERIAPLIQALSISFFISSTTMLQQSLIERSLHFNKVAKIEIASSVASALTGIILALHGFGVWSLVFQSIVLISTNTVLIWLLSTWRPRFQFKLSELTSISNYSLNLTASGIFNYLERNADNLLIGKFLGAQSLGYYSLAYRLMIYPITLISSVVGKVMFPTYAQIQDDDDKLRKVFVRVGGTIALITFPLMAGLFALSHNLVLNVFGPKWLESAGLVMVLAPIGLVQSISTTAGTLYQIKGRTDLLMRWSVVSGTVIMIAFGLGLKWGIMGVAIAYAMAETLLTYPWLAISFKLIKLNLMEFNKELYLPFISSLIMMVCLMLEQSFFPRALAKNIGSVTLIFSGIVFYLLISWAINRKQIKETLTLILS